MQTIPSSRKWRLDLLLLFHVLIALLFTSLFSPAISSIWKVFDIPFFETLNNTLRDRPNWQVFWALANHRLADWVEDVFILGFFTIYILRSPKERRLRCIAELIFTALIILVTILFINRGLFKDLLTIPRESPTRDFPFSIHLSEEISWLSIKDDSSRSFPADHATTAILFASLYWFFAGKRYGLFACLYAAFLCMPRLITGAHWLSDIVVGSGSIVLFILGWTLCTPLHNWVLDLIEKFLRLFQRKEKKSLA
jgi:Kdo2-lipid A phosphotransferase